MTKPFLTYAQQIDKLENEKQLMIPDHSYAEQTLRQMLKAEGLYLTGRFSPGYGDWPISVQPLLAQALDTPRRMGMCVTESFLMLPRKSVTAVLGVSGQPVTGYRAGCGHCALRETCEYRKRGQSCEG